jgi:hypothetical protein
MRRGVVLMDAILAGVVLGIGLAVMLSLASRTVAMQGEGQRQIVAAWLVDELLSMVLVEGPVVYPQLYATHGRFDPPFEDYVFEVDIEDIGLREPLRVTATVRWAYGGGPLCQAQTYIAERQDDPLEVREPLEPIDRLGRYYEDEGY